MNPQASEQLPPQMSTLAPQVDSLFYFIYSVSVISFVLIVGVMVFFVIKYRRRPGVKAETTGHNNWLEVAWVVAPMSLLVYLFHAGWQGYLFGAVAPTNALHRRHHADRGQELHHAVHIEPAVTGCGGVLERQHACVRCEIEPRCRHHRLHSLSGH